MKVDAAGQCAAAIPSQQRFITLCDGQLRSVAYLPCQFGLRFSAKAAAPSRASWLEKTGAM